VFTRPSPRVAAAATMAVDSDIALASLFDAARRVTLRVGHLKESIIMDEKTFEDIICKYPELIEDKLLFKGRQVVLKGKRVDVLFGDKHGQKLVVELKKDTVRREDIAQLLDYEGFFVSADDPTVRVMLIGRRVPENLRRSLDHHGFEWRELTTTMLINFLRQKGDYDLLNCLTPEDSLIQDPYKNETYSNSTVKHFSSKRVMKAANGVAIPAVNHSQDAVERAVARIREEFLNDPSFQLIRFQAEVKAKEMLDSTIGKMSPSDIRQFLDYVNTESIKGEPALTRFGRHFTNILTKQMYGCPQEFNEWIGALWKSKEDDIQATLATFLMNAPIKGAGSLLPTFVLYLRMPASFSIWTSNLENNLMTTFSYGKIQDKSRYERYKHFNRQVFDLLVKPFNISPQEVDLVLSKLPTYLI